MKCNHCLKEITQGKYSTDYWGNHYHFIHQGSVPKCNYCGRFLSKHLTGGGKVFPNRTSICGICSKDSIGNKNQIIKEYEMIISLMAKYAFDIRKYKTEIFLISRDESKKINNEEPGFINFTMKIKGNNVLDISFKIYILRGLPRTFFVETLAHELMHQWLILFGKDKMKPVLNEGSCNYLAYLIMKEIKTPLSYLVIDRLMKDPHPHYGKGFRKVLEYSKRNSHSTLLEYLKNHKSI
jgi:hypothetical protein